ncbi:hypothetical protein [Marinobacter sp.]|uniref:hypothetical protein n=1 Tax=Marinobacter sp. TaxID=50741 RepID=UPI0034A3E825
MRIQTSLALILASAVLGGCSGINTYRDNGNPGNTATLKVSVETDTIFDREIYVHLYDFEMIQSGEACGQEGLIFKEPIIKDNAYLGTIEADSDDPSATLSIPTKPLRAYVEFDDSVGNSTIINFIDVVFLAEADTDYSISYKRLKTSSGMVVGDFYFKMQTPEGMADIEKIADFDVSICDKYFD